MLLCKLFLFQETVSSEKGRITHHSKNAMTGSSDLSSFHSSCVWEQDPEKWYWQAVPFPACHELPISWSTSSNTNLQGCPGAVAYQAGCEVHSWKPQSSPGLQHPPCIWNEKRVFEETVAISRKSHSNARRGKKPNAPHLTCSQQTQPSGESQSLKWLGSDVKENPGLWVSSSILFSPSQVVCKIIKYFQVHSKLWLVGLAATANYGLLET